MNVLHCMCDARSNQQKPIYSPVHWISSATAVISLRKWQWACVFVCVVIVCDITTLISSLVIVETLWTERLNNERVGAEGLCASLRVWSRQLMSVYVLHYFLDEFLNHNHAWRCIRLDNTLKALRRDSGEWFENNF